MPLYELYRLAREKLDGESNNTGEADQCSSPENDFFELVWENGQISTQGQSSRVRRSPSCRSLPSHCLPSHSPRGRDKDAGYVTNSRMGKFEDLETGLNEFAMSVPSGEVDLGQDEDVLPWLDYTMDGSLQHEYGSDFLHELSGVTEHDLPESNSFALMDKRSNGNQVFRESQKISAEQGNFSRDSSAGEVETARPKASAGPLYPPSSQQCQTSFVPARSTVSDITENNTGKAMQHAPIIEIPSSWSDFSSLKMKKQDPVLPSNGSTVLNFSHFARPAAIMRANLQNIGLKSGPSSTRSEGMGSLNKCAAATSGECPKDPTAHCQKVVEQCKDDFKQAVPKSFEQNVIASNQTDPACNEKAIKIDQASIQIHGDNGDKRQTNGDKSTEPAVVSSSVGSGNCADRGSEEPNQCLKRKNRDTEDSECHSDDVEEESVGVKKAASGRGVAGSKRSRAAEVHNLSERRRRDRINEKMRALQELIPNCNKVDKASMLDEAIEYLKTLQLQVQIMSMGAGLYMPPMMLPPGMQHMHAPHMAPFSPMGMNMQMGLGMAYGMGMPDMNGVSSRFPMIQVPQMQGTHHLPVAHMMARSNSQGFGLPGQGFPVPLPHAPAFPFSRGPLMNSSAPGLHDCRGTGLVQTVDTASTSGLQDTMPNADSHVKQSTGGRDSTSQIPTQGESATLGFEPSSLACNSSHAAEASDRSTGNPGKEDDNVIGYD